MWLYSILDLLGKYLLLRMIDTLLNHTNGRL